MKKRKLPVETVKLDDDFLAERPRGNGKTNSGNRKRRRRKHPQNRRMSPAKKRRLIIAGLVGVLVLIICLIFFSCKGSQKGEAATENTICIDADGKVTEAIVEDWSGNLDEEELEDFIKDEIKTFQKENKGSKIKLEKFEIEDGKAKVILSYDSMATLAELNHTVSFAGTPLNSIEESEWYTGELISTKGETSIAFEEREDIEAAEEKGYTIYIVDGKYRVCTEKEILYANEDVKVADDRKSAEFVTEDSDFMLLVCK